MVCDFSVSINLMLQEKKKLRTKKITEKKSVIHICFKYACGDSWIERSILSYALREANFQKMCEFSQRANMISPELITTGNVSTWSPMSPTQSAPHLV